MIVAVIGHPPQLEVNQQQQSPKLLTINTLLLNHIGT